MLFKRTKEAVFKALLRNCSRVGVEDGWAFVLVFPFA
jgi:hypothetical protein